MVKANRASRGPRVSSQSKGKSKGTNSARQGAKGRKLVSQVLKTRNQRQAQKLKNRDMSVPLTPPGTLVGIDGRSFDEWNDDWSSVAWHEVWEQTYDTSASSCSFGGLDVSATSCPKRFEWVKMNLDTGAAVVTFPMNFGLDGAGDGISLGRCSLLELQAGIERWVSYVSRCEKKSKDKSDDEIKLAGGDTWWTVSVPPLLGWRSSSSSWVAVLFLCLLLGAVLLPVELLSLLLVGGGASSLLSLLLVPPSHPVPSSLPVVATMFLLETVVHRHRADTLSSSSRHMSTVTPARLIDACRCSVSFSEFECPTHGSWSHSWKHASEYVLE